MIRRLARPMLATVFVIDGVETLRNPQAHVENAAPLVDSAAPLVEKGEQVVNEHVSASVPPVPKDTETLVKALAGVKIGAGVLFALGKAPRLSALALTASHLPSTVSRHAFWTESDPAARSRKTTGLATDVALLGALLLASVDTAGQPGLAWRARKVGDQVSAKLPGAKAEAATAGAVVAGVAHSVADRGRDAVDTVRDKAPEVAAMVMGRAAAVRDQAAPLAEQARDRAVAAGHLAAEEAAPLAAEVRHRAEAVAGTVAGRVEDLDAKTVRKAAAEARTAAEKRRRKAEKSATKAREEALKKSDELRARAARVIEP